MEQDLQDLQDLQDFKSQYYKLIKNPSHHHHLQVDNERNLPH